MASWQIKIIHRFKRDMEQKMAVADRGIKKDPILADLQEFLGAMLRKHGFFMIFLLKEEQPQHKRTIKDNPNFTSKSTKMINLYNA